MFCNVRQCNVMQCNATQRSAMIIIKCKEIQFTHSKPMYTITLRQYLLTCKVSRYCLLPLQGKVAVMGCQLDVLVILRWIKAQLINFPQRLETFLHFKVIAIAGLQVLSQLPMTQTIPSLAYILIRNMQCWPPTLANYCQPHWLNIATSLM